MPDSPILPPPDDVPLHGASPPPSPVPVFDARDFVRRLSSEAVEDLAVAGLRLFLTMKAAPVEAGFPSQWVAALCVEVDGTLSAWLAEHAGTLLALHPDAASRVRVRPRALCLDPSRGVPAAIDMTRVALITPAPGPAPKPRS